MLTRSGTDSALSFKCVVVGELAVGKTCLLSTFATGKFPEEYVPTVFENQTVSVTVDGKAARLGVWDTAGHEDFARLRSLFYTGAHVIVLCFCVVEESHASYDALSVKWKDELSVHIPGVPIVLVGTKSDLRDDHALVQRLRKEGLEPLTPEDGRRAQQQIGAVDYIECSAKTKPQELGAVFEAAARAAARRAQQTGETVAQKGRGRGSSSPSMHDERSSPPADSAAGGSPAASASKSPRRSSSSDKGRSSAKSSGGSGRSSKEDGGAKDAGGKEGGGCQMM